MNNVDEISELLTELAALDEFTVRYLENVEVHIIYTDEDTKTNIREAIIQDSIQRACDTHEPRLFWFLSNDVLKEKIEYCADICVTDMLKELSSEKGDSAAIALLKAYVSALGEIENERVDGKSK